MKNERGRTSKHEPKLVVVPVLRAFVRGDLVGLTKKFVDGIKANQDLWPGAVHVLMEPSDRTSDNLDQVTFRRDEVPFDLTVTDFGGDVARDILRSATIAMLSVDWRQNRLARICHEIGVPCVYVSENGLRNRIRIAATEVPNPVRLLRRALWEINQERANRAAIRLADGVQCNGVPTFDDYRKINRSPLLFFDTRTRKSDLATANEINDRSKVRRQTGRLRLAFSGRLVAIKGVDHLVNVARFLKRAGRSFSLAICGTGDCEPDLRKYVAEHDLHEEVRFLGNLDFQSQLLPFLRSEVDLFVACHRQGDPSCTYLETMACGVPIAGYANEAFAGLVQVSHCGWTTPMNDPAKLASLIASLEDDEIDRHSTASLEFAADHTFETEFAKRIGHLRAIAGF